MLPRSEAASAGCATLSLGRAVSGGQKDSLAVRSEWE